METLQGRTAVITGAASGFGLEVARLAAREKMRLVLVDVQETQLEAAASELRASGAEVLPLRVDVSQAEAMDELGGVVEERFGTPHLVFNNAGVMTGGLIWEHTVKDWEWVLGVNLWGVANGVRVFVPRMLEAARRDASYEGHVVNTASMAGLVNSPTFGIYNASKHAVVSLSETLYHDLALVTDRVHASVLCPFFVPTGIHQSDRARPTQLATETAPTRSQGVAQAMSERAIKAGKVSASQIAERVLAAVRSGQFYIFSHPQALGGVRTRLEDVVSGRNPTDPLHERPELAAALRAALRDSD